MGSSSLEPENPQKNVMGDALLGKSKRKLFSTSGHIKASQIGQLAHSDLCGPMSVASPGGALYLIIFKDDFTGYRVLYFFNHKS